MHHAEPLDPRTSAADFRLRADRARGEATQSRLEPWRRTLLTESAAYYERRADDLDQQFRLTRPPASPSLLSAG